MASPTSLVRTGPWVTNPRSRFRTRCMQRCCTAHASARPCLREGNNCRQCPVSTGRTTCTTAARTSDSPRKCDPAHVQLHASRSGVGRTPGNLSVASPVCIQSERTYAKRKPHHVFQRDTYKESPPHDSWSWGLSNRKDDSCSRTHSSSPLRARC